MNAMLKRDKEPTRHSPYTDARREWNERYGSYIAHADNWRRMAFGSMGVAAVAVGACVWLAAQSNVAPYVVEVDKLGDAIAVGRADRAPPNDSRVIRQQLARWLVDVRTVSSDPEAVTRNVDEAYAMTDKNGPALQVLNDWYGTHEPYKRAATGAVVASVSYVRWRVGHTWLIGWREEERPTASPALPAQDWEAEVIVATNPPTTDAGIQANATGTFITSFNWGPKQ